jgi:hypothetical protein
MNKYQRMSLIGAGLLIAIFQINGIASNGLEHAGLWPLSYLAAALLLFVGLGSWGWIGELISMVAARTSPELDQSLRRQPKELPALGGNLIRPRAPVPSNTPPASRVTRAPARKEAKHTYGIHISELDLAVETTKSYAEKTGLYDHLAGNGRTVNWNCCALVYASMRYAARRQELLVHRVTWNTIVHAVVVRMSTQEVKDVGLGSFGDNELEREAYDDLALVDKAIEQALALKGTSILAPIVRLLALMFGTKEGQATKALTAIVGMTADTAAQKILPEMLADLS